MGAKDLYPKLLAFCMIMLVWPVLAWPVSFAVGGYGFQKLEREHPGISEEAKADIINGYTAIALLLFVSPILTIPAGVGGMLYRRRLIREGASAINSPR